MNTGLHRDGPGLLLRDILRSDPQITAFANVVRHVGPDILVLQGVDYDHDLITLTALRDTLKRHGSSQFEYMFAKRPNAGMATGLDMDGDGYLGRARDKQGYGRFAGEGGLAILSSYPILTQEVQDFTALKWLDLPGSIPPKHMGAPYPSTQAQEAQRLSSMAHWIVPIRISPKNELSLLTFHATPPVFDGPEDRNGRRNHDELRFWQVYLNGHFGPAPRDRFVLLGDANLDPVDGEGRKQAIRDLLSDPRLQDPRPKRPTPAAQGPGQAARWPGSPARSVYSTIK
jgi:hypothetical protein